MEEKVKKETKTVFNSYERSSYGTILSIDLTTRFIKEFLTAQMYLDMVLVSTGDPVVDEERKKLWNEKVQPFFDHVGEILDTL